MIVYKFRIEVNGNPVRLYTDSNTKQRCAEPDAKGYNTFGSPSDAEKKAALWGLTGYSVLSFQRDIGTPTKLAEIGF